MGISTAVAVSALWSVTVASQSFAPQCLHFIFLLQFFVLLLKRTLAVRLFLSLRV
jgi:hypothetical protein